MRAPPLGPSDFNLAQHSPTTRPSVERTTAKAVMRLNRIELSSAEAHATFGHQFDHQFEHQFEHQFDHRAPARNSVPFRGPDVNPR